jgi:tetratricopeptide (TPR) repeat protein
MKPKSAALAAGLLLIWPVMGAAMVPGSDAEMRQYIHARLADVGGQPDQAASIYAKLLQQSPNDKLLALRTYRQALTAGNFRLASQAAQELDKAKALPPDATLMLLADTVTAHQWDKANLIIARIEREQVFAFLTPVMRGWVAYGHQVKDPAKLLAPNPGADLSNAYARDHHLLIALAEGRTDVLADLRRLISANDVRAVRLQIAAAAVLAKHKDMADARSILAGSAPELAIARAAVDAGKVPAGAIDTPALGLSELFAQLAIDVKGDGHSPIALQLARLASYLAPENAAAQIAAADLLASNGYRDTALALLHQVPADNPLAETARQERAGILMATGNREAALADAERYASQPNADPAAFIELGGILSELEKPAEAAKAFQQAADFDRAHGNKPNWTYLFLEAGALDRAGHWEDAKTLLRQANTIDPNQAIVLNYLGYGMLDHGENLADAQGFIERASALDPNDAAITDSLGWLLYKRGDYARAVPALERAVAGDPGQSVINEHLGDAYWATGRHLEARYAWRAALVQADKPSTDRLNAKISDGPSAAVAAK